MKNKGKWIIVIILSITVILYAEYVNPTILINFIYGIVVYVLYKIVFTFPKLRISI